MKFANRNNTFTIKEAKKSIVYQIRICKKETTNLKIFQAHFGRKPNTLLSIINKNTIQKLSNLSYEKILNHYLDADTVPVEDYLTNNDWITEETSEGLVEEAMTKSQVDAGRRYNGDKNKSIS